MMGETMSKQKDQETIDYASYKRWSDPYNFVSFTSMRDEMEEILREENEKERLKQCDPYIFVSFTSMRDEIEEILREENEKERLKQRDFEYMRTRKLWADSTACCCWMCSYISEMEIQMEEYKKKERQKERPWFGFYVTEKESSERRTNTKLDEILENWLKTEGKSTDAVDFLKNYQPLPPEEAMSKKKRNMKHHEMLPMSVKTDAVVEDDAIMEREKLTDISEELSGEFDDEENEKRELEQLLRCKVCLDSDACVVLFPCRHMATCEYCEGFLQCCPVCRSFIDEAVKVNEEN